MNFQGCQDKIGCMYFVNDYKIKLLKEIIDRTGAKVVLSSTWRYGWFERDEGLNNKSVNDFNALENKLKEFDITFLSRTPKSKSGYRGSEIDQWLKHWGGEKIDNFIILDDDNDMNPYMDKLIQTSFSTGLTQESVNRAIEMLNSK